MTQTTHYYPYGGTLTHSTNQGVQKYKYNGKEFDRTHGLDWYDYCARQYDPASGRFTSMDPLCEKYYNISPYMYCAGNPIRYVDPTGCEGVPVDSLGNSWSDFDINEDWVELHPVVVNGQADNDYMDYTSYGATIVDALVDGSKYVQLGSNGKVYFRNYQKDGFLSAKAGGIFNGNQYVTVESFNTPFARGLSKATTGISMAAAVVDIYNCAVNEIETTGTVGYNTYSEATKQVGGIAGGFAGAKAGAAIGAGIGVYFGGIGAVPGAIIGSIGFGIAGSIMGEEIAGKTFDMIYNLNY